MKKSFINVIFLILSGFSALVSPNGLIEDRLINRVHNLKAVRIKEAMILKQSNGKRHFSFICQKLNNKIYLVGIYEDNGVSFVHYFDYRINIANGRILSTNREL